MKQPHLHGICSSAMLYAGKDCSVPSNADTSFKFEGTERSVHGDTVRFRVQVLEPGPQRLCFKCLPCPSVFMGKIACSHRVRRSIDTLELLIAGKKRSLIPPHSDDLSEPFPSAFSERGRRGRRSRRRHLEHSRTTWPDNILDVFRGNPLHLSHTLHLTFSA